MNGFTVVILSGLSGVNLAGYEKFPTTGDFVMLDWQLQPNRCQTRHARFKKTKNNRAYSKSVLYLFLIIFIYNNIFVFGIYFR